jgi:hypothetical protein
MPKQVVLISTHCFGSTSNLKTSFEKVLLYIYLHLHQRRTPYATINVLRAEQLEKAESKRVTADLYARNIDVLNKYGYDNLEKALEADKKLTS